jgi:EAL domain-containing protein (putative c-di-GMP-specific phosphodiesterase class I)
VTQSVQPDLAVQADLSVDPDLAVQPDLAVEPDLAAVLEGVGLRADYQPVVHLETGRVLGYEALARGPVGLEDPTVLLDAARREGRSAQFDWRCRDAAFAGAIEAGLGNSLTLFVNIEPDTAALVPVDYLERVAEAGSQLRIVLEVTERAVVEQPAELLRLVDWARERSWGIALDDIGEDPGSLAMMPFLEPDVIKLDLRLVKQRPTPEIGLIMSAVLAQAERTGAVIIAEGIEDDAGREAALALGATLGQGWLYGRPQALPAELQRVDDVVPLHRTWSARDDPTPFTIARAALPVRRASKAQLLGIAQHLEEQAVAWSDGPVVLSTFQVGEQVDETTLARYRELAVRGSFVAALRTGSELAVGTGVRTAALPDGHRLGDEWSVVVVGPHYAGALVARQLTADPDAGYDFVCTHRRELVVEAGRALLRHVSPGL